MIWARENVSRCTSLQLKTVCQARGQKSSPSESGVRAAAAAAVAPFQPWGPSKWHLKNPWLLCSLKWYFEQLEITHQNVTRLCIMHWVAKKLSIIYDC